MLKGKYVAIFPKTGWYAAAKHVLKYYLLCGGIVDGEDYCSFLRRPHIRP